MGVGEPETKISKNRRRGPREKKLGTTAIHDCVRVLTIHITLGTILHASPDLRKKKEGNYFFVSVVINLRKTLLMTECYSILKFELLLHVCYVVDM